MKYLLVLAVLAIAYNVWRRSRRSEATPPPARRTPLPPQAMVPCAQCGLQLPQTDAVAHDGRYYCSPAHRDQGPH